VAARPARRFTPWIAGASELEYDANMCSEAPDQLNDRLDTGREEDPRYRRRYLQIIEAPDGGYELRGYLDPVGGAIVKRALDTILERQDREARRELGDRFPNRFP
jgi:hypothetical protein